MPQKDGIMGSQEVKELLKSKLPKKLELLLIMQNWWQNGRES
jgi:hypothetical protein